LIGQKCEGKSEKESGKAGKCLGIGKSEFCVNSVIAFVYIYFFFWKTVLYQFPGVLSKSGSKEVMITMRIGVKTIKKAFWTHLKLGFTLKNDLSFRPIPGNSGFVRSMLHININALRPQGFKINFEKKNDV